MAVYYYNTNLCDIPSHFFETQIYDHSHSEGDLWSRVRRRLTNRYYNKPSYSYKCKYHNRKIVLERKSQKCTKVSTCYHLGRSTLIVAYITSSLWAKQHERASFKMPRSPRWARKAPAVQVTLIAVEYARKGKVYLLGSINSRCLGNWARTPERALFSSLSLHVQPFFVTQRSSSALRDDTKKGCEAG